MSQCSSSALSERASREGVDLGLFSQQYWHAWGCYLDFTARRTKRVGGRLRTGFQLNKEELQLSKELHSRAEALRKRDLQAAKQRQQRAEARFWAAL